ncbi:DUF5103 domain-containing protein [Olivibacter sp. SA151]|uniref:type IX secretion system plug protein n=1 Tax=Olivibacter jilunii TaxID=985016 RepID=UPI003F156390
MRFSLGLFFMLVVFNATQVSAQKKEKKRVRMERSPEQDLRYEDVNYLPVIKSVQFYQAKEEQSLPLMTLGGGDQFFLSFDDLRADNRTYYYTIEHCTSDWRSSNLSTIEYIDGLTEDRLYDYKSSVNTLQAYTHYELRFPNEGSMIPKLPGNYLLKVYEDADKARLILTRRFYVLRQDVSVGIKTLPSFNVIKRKENQKLNLEINLGNIQLNNPYQDIKLVVKQNRRNDVQEVLTKPMFVRDGQLIYNNNATLDFDGGNEFRNLDLRSFRLLSGQISASSKDSIRRMSVMLDHDLSQESYSFSYDEDGKFFLRNSDFENSDFEGDYAAVTFTLKTSSPPAANEKIYIAGLFNNFATDGTNEMKYDPDQKQWQGELLLKQGLYHYTYISKINGKEQLNRYDGHHFETGNTYDVFVYYRKPATRWEELIGFGTVNTSSKGPIRD